MLRTIGSPMPPASSASAGIARRTSARRGDRGVRRHRADRDAAGVDLDRLQVGDAAEVDEPLRLRQAQLHRLDQALAAGEVARVGAGWRRPWRRRGWPGRW